MQEALTPQAPKRPLHNGVPAMRKAERERLRERIDRGYALGGTRSDRESLHDRGP